MKTKLFTAVLACLSVAMLFSGCKDDKNDDAVHAYVMRAAITEAGDLDALTVTLINSELESMCNQVGTKILTESEAREMFDLMVKQIEKSMESIDFGDITKPVGFTVTLNYQNDGKVAFSKTFTVDACRRKAVLSYPEVACLFFIPAGLVDSVSIAIFTKFVRGDCRRTIRI